MSNNLKDKELAEIVSEMPDDETIGIQVCDHEGIPLTEKDGSEVVVDLKVSQIKKALAYHGNLEDFFTAALTKLKEEDTQEES